LKKEELKKGNPDGKVDEELVGKMEDWMAELVYENKRLQSTLE